MAAWLLALAAPLSACVAAGAGGAAAGIQSVTPCNVISSCYGSLHAFGIPKEEESQNGLLTFLLSFFDLEITGPKKKGGLRQNLCAPVANRSNSSFAPRLRCGLFPCFLGFCVSNPNSPRTAPNT